MRGFSHSWAVLLLLAGLSTAFDFGYPYVESLPGQDRIRRDTAVKHKTQHLKPAIEIEPLPNQRVKVPMPHINGKELSTLATQAATSINSRFDQVEPTLFTSTGAKLVPGTPAWYMAASHKIKIVAKNISRIALIAEEASKLMSQSMKLTKDQITFGLPVMDVRGTILSEQCPLEVDFPCQPRKYRAFNGYCNNVQNPRWGNANTRYLRFLPPDYSDGVSIPRQALSGSFLPSAREVSLAVHRDIDNPHAHLTALTAVWGEIILHDISHTPQMAGYLGQRLRCCGVSLNDFHPECYPIRVPDTDPVYSKLNVKCQEYVRSGTAPRVGCTLGPREQINQVTSYLDASVLYGSSAEEANELRLFRGGLLKTQTGNSTKGILPADDNVVDCRSKDGIKCFKAGDVRSNEHVELSALHVLLLREHNRLASELAKVNPHWSDETLFQEARRIVGAELQHITYSEFLPVVLGQSVMDKYGLEPEQTGYFTGYDININPGIANSVAAAALRFVTSLMPKTMHLYQKGRKVAEENMGSSFYAPFALYKANSLDMILEGMVRTKAQAEDQFINEVMTSHMFEDKADGSQGLDLAAQIIQQGRDHGIPGYVKWREFCGLPKIQTFEQLSDVMASQTITTLKLVYRSVEDIDLFTGGIAEISNKGALVGPTFGCLIGRQFHYLRRGDRYWYENELPPSSFTKDQLHAIRKTSLARLICDNSDGMTVIQPRVFLASDPFLNADMSCTDGVITRMDLNAWKTASPHFVIPDTLLQESVSRAKREADDYLLQEQALLQEASTTTLATYYDAITNLSVWNNSTSSLILTRTVTPPNPRQFDFNSIPNPSLKAWLAPIFLKFPTHYTHDYPNDNQWGPQRRQDTLAATLDHNNLIGHLGYLLDTMNPPPSWEMANQRQANDYLHESVSVARRVADLLDDYEVDLWTQRKGADPKSPVGTAFSFSRPKRQATLIANVSRVLQFASKRFVNSFLNANNQKDLEARPQQPSTVQDLMQVLPNIDVSDVVDIPKVFQCDEQTLPCDHTSKFRTMTGWCNNLNFPEFGKSMRAFSRLLPPRYEDGISVMRTRAISGRPLPSARMVSANIHNDVSAPHVRYSLMVMQFGQLLDHDLTFTPVNRGFGGSILDCSGCDSARIVHPECAPIPVPNNDPWYPAVDRTTGKAKCISFTRSLPGQLTLGYREQLNQVTAFVDASHTYGSDVCESRMLRSFIGGRLNATRHPIRGKDLLPQTNVHPECKSPTNVCFEGGDTRASEQPGLASIHTVFMREHNRIVDELARINPHWTDEQLFQNGRRIMSAEFQHVTYNEFLPRVLGWNAVQLYELKVLPEGYYNGYDPTCNPTIFNEFAAAAFRFGHSLLKDQLRRLGANYEDRKLPVKLRDGFNNPDVLYQPGMIDEILRGLLGTSMETLDQFITHEVTNHLFEEKHVPFSGLDLASLNIQRARDHGIPAYNEYRALCNLKRAKTFDDLSREITPDVINRLKQTYETVDDIDLFPGALSETPLHGGLVGPTFACIIAMQFRQLRKCDRFWYENGDPLIRFTEAQLTEIRKASIAKIVCDNSDGIDTVQRSGFDQYEAFLNPRVPCKNLPSIDLELWKERVSCTVGALNIEVGKAERISPCVMCTCTKEGPVCQSLKIINCFQLAQTFSPAAILNDHVCKVQCAFAFRAFPQVAAATADPNQLGFS